MFTLKNEIQFDAAHYLSEYPGKCANIHGHRYRLVVSTCKQQLEESGPMRGMVDDFSHIKSVLHELETEFDHKLLVEDNADGKQVANSLKQLPNQFAVILLPFRPTCEEMARYFYKLLQHKGLPVSAVELFETPTNSCIYTE